MDNCFSELQRRFNVPFKKSCLLKQDFGFRDVALNLITPLRLSALWRLIKMRAAG
jgi:hypothetical protein